MGLPRNDCAISVQCHGHCRPPWVCRVVTARYPRKGHGYYTGTVRQPCDYCASTFSVRLSWQKIVPLLHGHRGFRMIPLRRSHNACRICLMLKGLRFITNRMHIPVLYKVVEAVEPVNLYDDCSAVDTSARRYGQFTGSVYTPLAKCNPVSAPYTYMYEYLHSFYCLVYYTFKAYSLLQNE